MPVDPELLQGLQAAIVAAPRNLALRVHAAALLLEAGRPAEALAQCGVVLETAPDHQQALEVAARAADAVGDHEQALGYRRRRLPVGEPAEPSQPAGEPRLIVPPIRIPVARDPADGYLGEVDQPRLTLGDLGGMEGIKRRLRTTFLGPLRDPRFARLFGRSLRGGLLLYGPPGCGKTAFARAMAGELASSLLSVDLAHVLDMWVGYSERTLHEIFETARRSAPCVLYLDELDVLGVGRRARRYTVGHGVVDQLVAELYSVSEEHEGVFVIAASEHPWDIDPTLRHPGRFDHTLLVLPPDAEAREAIIRGRLQSRPVTGLDVASLADRTEGFSASDLVVLCETVAEGALEASLVSGSERAITDDDFNPGLGRVRPSTPAWFELARRYALHPGEPLPYEELVAYLRRPQ
jgi:SpoVK/Ycf46/Vps4 family AAA+-type ATPase